MVVELEMKKSDSDCGEERLTEVRQSRNSQKGGEGRLEEDRRRDGSTRRRRTNLEKESRQRKVGHVPTRAGAWNSGRRRRVACGDMWMTIFRQGFL